MIAEIIPLRNLPRTRSTFSYKIPLLTERDFKIGQLVEVPFQKTNVLGVIHSITNAIADDKAKEIYKIINNVPFFGTQQLAMLTRIGSLYGASLPTLIKMSLPKIRKIKFSKTLLVKQTETIETKKNFNPKYNFYKNQSEHDNFLNAGCHGTILILVPRIQNISEVYSALDEEKQKNTIIWHSELKDKDQYNAWLKIRNGEYNIIIATRGGVFLPFVKLDSIIIDYEHDENHKHWDQTPRFNAKDIAKILAERFGSEYAEMSFSPGVEAYYNIHRKNWVAENFNFNTADNRIDVYGSDPPMILQSMVDKYNFIPSVVQEKISEVLNSNGEKKDIFILLNRKGFAAALMCRQCGLAETCAVCNMVMVYQGRENVLKCPYCKIVNPIPPACSKCGSAITKLTGPGIEMIETEAKKMVENKNYDIITIDSESTKLLGQNNSIIVGTDAALPFVRWNRTALVIYLGLDREINLPEFGATEKVWHKIQEIQFRKNSDALLILATNHIEHVVFKSLLEPDRFYRTDLNTRQKANYPPYSVLVKYFYGNFSQKTAQDEAVKTAKKLQTELTKTGIKVIIVGPIEMYPLYYRRKYWYAIIAKFESQAWEKDSKIINNLIPDSWKIDLNPISLLSP